MPRLKQIEPETTAGRTRELLDQTKVRMGKVPNLIKTLANSPAALEAYLGFSDALSNGVIPAQLREQIALAVSEANNCRYCLAAHSAVGKMVGLSDEEIQDSRQGTAVDGKTEAALRFSRQLVEKLGWVNDGDVGHLRDAGYGDEEIAEIVAHVARNIFTNYFNHVAETIVDFPEAPALFQNNPVRRRHRLRLGERRIEMKINLQKAAIAGIAGTVLFDLVGFALTGKFWDIPALLGAKLVGEGGLALGVFAHYGNGIALGVIYAALAPSLWGNDYARSLTYTTVQTVVGVYLFMMPLLGMGIFGHKAGLAVPVIALVRHWAYAIALARLYPVTEKSEIHFTDARVEHAA